MATATGLFNLVRNVGGSAGIAVMTTWLSRQTQVHQAALVGRVTIWDRVAVERLDLLERAYTAGGADASTAHAQALQRLYAEVQRQAAMLAFLDDFRILTLLFLVFVPLVWCMGRTPEPAEAAPPAVAVEPA
jgi:DHA2 family multidrug resistance protein